jgi:hypothetical protein
VRETPDNRSAGQQEPRNCFPPFRQEGELALERLARAPEQCLDRPDANILVLCDLLVRQAGVSQREYLLVPRRETLQGKAGDLLLLACDNHILRDVDCLRRSQSTQVLSRPDARTTARHVGADVLGDHPEPWIEAALSGKLR